MGKKDVVPEEVEFGFTSKDFDASVMTGKNRKKRKKDSSSETETVSFSFSDKKLTDKELRAKLKLASYCPRTSGCSWNHTDNRNK